MTMLAVFPESSLAVASRVFLFGVLMPKGEKCSSRTDVALCVSFSHYLCRTVLMLRPCVDVSHFTYV